MNTRSAKAKGRRLSTLVKQEILELLEEYGIQDADITVTPAGVNGPDLIFSPKALEIFPFDVECKNQERLNIWSAIAQVEVRRVRTLIPVIVFSKNRQKPWIAMELEQFSRIWKSVLRNGEV